MVDYSCNHKEVVQLACLSELRKKNVREIAEIVKSVKEDKKKLNADSDEKHNLKQLQKFTDSLSICFDMCKNNLTKKLEKDIIEYSKLNSEHNLSLNEESKKNIENHYKQLEEQLCYYACSKKYNHILSNKMQ